MNLNGVEYYYIRNAQGNIIGVFDKNATTIASYNYDSWGKLISIKDGSGTDITNNAKSVGYKNPYRYRGYRYDTETGLYYLQSRYYNPEWGRFINADDIGGRVGELLSHNVFAYCSNNPVNREGPNGHFWWLLIPAAIEIVSVIIAVAEEYGPEILEAGERFIPEEEELTGAIQRGGQLVEEEAESVATKKGGAYESVPKNGGENHHMPANSVSNLSKNKGPALNMEKADHRMTASWGNSKETQLYRAQQKSLIDQGKFMEAQQMDIDDVTSKFGSKYNEGISQMKDYTIQLFKD